MYFNLPNAFHPGLSPCGVSATGGRGQIYLTRGGLFPATFNHRLRYEQLPAFHQGFIPLRLRCCHEKR